MDIYRGLNDGAESEQTKCPQTDTHTHTHTHTPAQVLRQAPGSCNSDVRSFCRVVGFTLCCKLLSQRVMAF